ncbi:hypothetical protein [Streptomyces physcomitrii]|uniref:Uncharacterized protein n=1 Tax=Streptomyces physcomitrii TaxID=2724184 RepID=A0ABX1GWY6_9ACTN|nr:hypothetical protein [Streptomyces physcomitrii]NKI40297.1 hypothetical protein [Streptomyces physcomitrii]
MSGRLPTRGWLLSSAWVRSCRGRSLPGTGPIGLGLHSPTSEITACRHDKLTQKWRAAGLGAIADLRFFGLDDIDPGADLAAINACKAAENGL